MRSKTRFVMVRVLKDWSGPSASDRRRYRRFEAGAVEASIALIGTQDSRLTLDACRLLDVSYGGMCLLADEPLAKGGVHRFLIEFVAPFSDVVLVKACVAWMRPSDDGVRIGVRFLESSKGWLGPEA